MSRRSGSKSQQKKQELKLDLSLAMRGSSSATVSEDVASPSSCLTSSMEKAADQLSSPEATSMVLAACPRCFMYVMLAEEDPKCPKCKSPVILDFLQGCNAARARKSLN